MAHYHHAHADHHAHAHAHSQAHVNAHHAHAHAHAHTHVHVHAQHPRPQAADQHPTPAAQYQQQIQRQQQLDQLKASGPSPQPHLTQHASGVPTAHPKPPRSATAPHGATFVLPSPAPPARAPTPGLMSTSTALPGSAIIMPVPEPFQHTGRPCNRVRSNTGSVTPTHTGIIPFRGMPLCEQESGRFSPGPHAPTHRINPDSPLPSCFKGGRRASNETPRRSSLATAQPLEAQGSYFPPQPVEPRAQPPTRWHIAPIASAGPDIQEHSTDMLQSVSTGPREMRCSILVSKVRRDSKTVKADDNLLPRPTSFRPARASTGTVHKHKPHMALKVPEPVRPIVAQADFYTLLAQQQLASARTGNQSRQSPRPAQPRVQGPVHSAAPASQPQRMAHPQQPIQQHNAGLPGHPQQLAQSGQRPPPGQTAAPTAPHVPYLTEHQYHAMLRQALQAQLLSPLLHTAEAHQAPSTTPCARPVAHGSGPKHVQANHPAQSLAGTARVPAAPIGIQSVSRAPKGLQLPPLPTEFAPVPKGHPPTPGVVGPIMRTAAPLPIPTRDPMSAAMAMDVSPTSTAWVEKHEYFIDGGHKGGKRMCKSKSRMDYEAHATLKPVKDGRGPMFRDPFAEAPQHPEPKKSPPDGGRPKDVADLERARQESGVGAGAGVGGAPGTPELEASDPRELGSFESIGPIELPPQRDQEKHEGVGEGEGYSLDKRVPTPYTRLRDEDGWLGGYEI